ncbi:cysteine proteinase inhibitor [Striga asiatica]|uniref:Cysteine proteinase inhibitor n=1 Tax=Striga asiatica TaxID=4170 RepID=A0A5A7QHJ3_STRAF|nr:cysteine proteinase inhibitor [Striga asiatica]
MSRMSQTLNQLFGMAWLGSWARSIRASSKGGGGQWTPLTRHEIKSNDMIALANYTVIEHNKEKKMNLGHKYNLSETTTDYDNCTTPIWSCDGVLGSYNAVVWVQDWKNLTKLVSFKKIK